MWFRCDGVWCGGTRGAAPAAGPPTRGTRGPGRRHPELAAPGAARGTPGCRGRLPAFRPRASLGGPGAAGRPEAAPGSRGGRAGAVSVTLPKFTVRRSQRQRCRLTWRPPRVKLHRLHQAAVAPSPHRQTRAWPKSTRSCPRAERVHHRRRRRTRRHRRSTCKLSRRGWCTREDTERSTSLSSLHPSPRLSGSSTHGRITVAGPRAPALPARHTARRCMSSADDPPLGARAGSPTRRRRSSSSSSRTSR